MTNNQQRRQLFCATPPYTSHITVANPENTQKDTDIPRTWRVARHCPPRKSAPSPLSPSQSPLLSPFISAPKPLFLPLHVSPLSSLLSYLPPWPVALVCRPLSSLRRAAHNRRRGSCRIHTQHPPPSPSAPHVPCLFLVPGGGDGLCERTWVVPRSGPKHWSKYQKACGLQHGALRGEVTVVKSNDVHWLDDGELNTNSLTPCQ